MSKLIKFFNFSFLKKLDRHILLNYPKIWTFKLPYVIFYSLLMNAFLMITLLFVEQKSYEVLGFIDLMILPWTIILFFFFKWMNYHAQIEKEYRKNILSGLEEFLILLFTFFMLGTSLYAMKNIVVLKKYPYKTSHHEHLITYVDDDNDSKSLAISTIEELKASKYKEEFIEIILDLTSVSKRENITPKSIKLAKENYTFYYDLNSYEWIGLELTLLIIGTLFLVYFRIIGLKNLLFTVLATYPIFFFLTMEATLVQLLPILVYEFCIIYLVYIFTQNKLLTTSMLTVTLLWTLMAIVDNLGEENFLFPLNLFALFLMFIIISLFISFIKTILIKVASEPKKV